MIGLSSKEILVGAENLAFLSRSKKIEALQFPQLIIIKGRSVAGSHLSMLKKVK